MRLLLTSTVLLLSLGGASASIVQRRQTSSDASPTNGSDSSEVPPLAFVFVGDTMTGALVPYTSSDPSSNSSDPSSTSSGWSAGFCYALSNVSPELCVSFAAPGPAPAENPNPPLSDDENSDSSTDTGDSGDALPPRLGRRQTNGDNSTVQWEPKTAAAVLADPTLFPAALAAIKDFKAQGVQTVYVPISFGNDDEAAGTTPANMAVAVKTMLQSVKDAGGEPVLVTTMTRRGFGDNGLVHDGLRPYATALIDLSHEEKVPATDFHWSSLQVCTDLGPSDCAWFSLTANDTIYLNNDGSMLFGRLAAELVKTALPLGVVGLTPNWELRKEITKYLSMGRVAPQEDNSALGFGVSVMSLRSV